MRVSVTASSWHWSKSEGPMAASTTLSARPLDGVRVLELGQLIAGPFAGCILAYFGAEVIKIEPPEKGDPLRGWRILEHGTSLWWCSLGRNKKCITLHCCYYYKQNLRNSRWNELPVKRIDGSLLMGHEHLTRTLV